MVYNICNPWIDMKKLILILISLTLIAFKNTAATQTSASVPLKQFLQQQPAVKVVKPLEVDGFKEAYELRFIQPLDHKDASKGTFEQRVHVMHRDKNAPTHIWISGYQTYFPMNTNGKEMAEILNSNLVVVEYRFYGQSLPEDGKVPYEFLDNTQGATDHHEVIDTFKQYYQNKWVSSGFSKGGESALIHLSMFPDDVDAVVTYDAPIIHGREDPRTDAFLYAHGSKECRTRLFDYQRIALENREAMLEKVEAYAKNKKLNYSWLGYGGALEYAVLEHTFTFWQRGHKCEEVPQRGDSVDAIFKHLVDTSGLWFYSDEGIHATRQSYYQHMRELGYYGFPTERLSDLLVDAKDASNLHLAPKGVDLTYNPEFMWNVHKWLDKNGNNIIYLYGENDTWKAAAVEPTINTNAIRLDQKNGSHWTHVKNLSEEQKQLFYDTLDKWLGYKVNRL